MCLFCVNCGQCGKPLPPEVETARKAPLRCFACGSTVELGLSHCPTCGKPTALPPGAK